MSGRTVVVLQAEQAFWFRWQGSELIDSFVESVCADSLTNGVRCPWLACESETAQHCIELVLDTNMDELDKVKLEVPAGRRVGIARLWRLQQSLRRDYPSADVYRLPTYKATDVMSIHHPLIPEVWCSWLQKLQSSHVYLTHVVTATELISCCEHAEKGPSLYCLELSGERRHLLVDQGVPMFMRIVKSHSSTGSSEPMQIASDLQKTLEHVSEDGLDEAGVVTVLTPLAKTSNLPTVSHAAFVLSALCANGLVDFTMRHWVGGSVTDSVSRTQVRLPVGTQKLRRLFRSGFEILPWALPKIQPAAHNRRFRVVRNQRMAPGLFKPSVADSLLRQRISALRDATVLSVVLASLTVCLATMHGLNSARLRAALSDQQAVLTAEISTLNGAVSRLHPSPEYVLNSVQRIEGHALVSPLGPEYLLAKLADAITAFPQMILETLSWSVLGIAETSGSMAAININMPRREYLWGHDVGRDPIQIEISGTVAGDQGLQEQYRALQSFVAYLEALPGISTVQVLESPAEAARSSALLTEAGSRYRLSLVLNAS